MKKTLIFLCGLGLLLSCSEPKYYEADFQARQEANDGALKPFMTLPEGISAQEKDALEFLYAYMPLADVTDYSADFYLRNVRSSLMTREEMNWGVPEREFRHFVLPLRVNNESLDSARTVFCEELKPRIKGMSMKEAILEVNHWCHEKVTYTPSDARTSSPLNLVKNALGRCGEQSTFCVTALRSVGIPARQVYTPRWAHTDDNHAWVEAWADGTWYFLGACEPEPVLNLGWFNAPASRAMLMHTKVFGKYDGPEEVVLESPNFTEVNLIDNYAKTARIDFRVVWADNAPDNLAGKPVEGARVDFCIYNYAEFYPAVSKYTDADGRTFTSAGLGDMLVWASKDRGFGYTKVSFGKDTEAVITLRYMVGNEFAGPEGVKEAFTLVPPPENVTLPEVTPEQRAQNDVRFAYEDSLRHAYEATFPAGNKARGNWETLEAFQVTCGNHERIEEVLNSLSTKDFHDVTLEILQDYYSTPVFRGSRIENEFLTPFYSYFAEKLEEIHSPRELVTWTEDNIKVLDNPKAWNIPMSPAGVYESRLALPRSRDLFFVAAARAKGFEAQKDLVTGKIQYKENGQWLDVNFGGNAPAAAAPQGTLKLTYKPTKAVENPQYYTHFTLSKIVDGRPSLLSFDEGEVDMGGGVDWAHVFKNGHKLDAGTYLLASGNRLSDGSVPVSMCFFAIEEGKETVQELRIGELDGALPVIGQFDAETRVSIEGKEVSILSQTGRGYYVLALLDPGKEPTNHALRDLAAAREQLESWGRPIVLLCSSPEALSQLLKEEKEGRYGKLPATVLFGVAPEGMLDGARPVVLIADSFNRVFFRSEGYTIGLGNQLSAASTALK